MWRAGGLAEAPERAPRPYKLMMAGQWAEAARMSISPKTVDHHVSSVLAKLQIHTRGEAAAIARGLDEGA